MGLSHVYCPDGHSLKSASLKMASAENSRENVHFKGCGWGEESLSAWVQLKGQPNGHVLPMTISNTGSNILPNFI